MCVWGGCGVNTPCPFVSGEGQRVLVWGGGGEGGMLHVHCVC